MRTNPDTALFLARHLEALPAFEKLTAPLFRHFGINLYTHCVLFETGEWGFMTNSHAWLEHCLAHYHADQINDFSPVFAAYKCPKLGTYLEDLGIPDTLGVNDSLVRSLHEADHHHALMIRDCIETPQGWVWRLTRFCGPKSDKGINQTYLNHLPLLNRFNTHITKTFAPLYTPKDLAQPTAKELRLIKEKRLGKPVPLDKDVAAFLKDTGLHDPRYVQQGDLSLTQRQREIIHWFLLGKTEAETAEILFISVNTVRDHFHRLKARFNCYSKTQLLQKLLDAGLIDPTDWHAIYPRDGDTR